MTASVQDSALRTSIVSSRMNRRRSSKLLERAASFMNKKQKIWLNLEESFERVFRLLQDGTSSTESRLEEMKNLPATDALKQIQNDYLVVDDRTDLVLLRHLASCWEALCAYNEMERKMAYKRFRKSVVGSDAAIASMMDDSSSSRRPSLRRMSMTMKSGLGMVWQRFNQRLSEECSVQGDKTDHQANVIEELERLSEECATSMSGCYRIHMLLKRQVSSQQLQEHR